VSARATAARRATQPAHLRRCAGVQRAMRRLAARKEERQRRRIVAAVCVVV
jgi:hypothetical protein